KGVSMVERGDIEMLGVSIPDTGRAEGIANAAKFVDWMYTDEALELLSWGKEGETYEVVDGKKQYILEDGELPNSKYGFTTYGSFVRIDPEAIVATQSETTIESEKMLLEHTLPYFPVTEWIDLNDEEDKIIADKATGCTTYTKEMISKFILGQEPLSGYDTFIGTLEEMGVAKILEAYESAYARVK
ncbi:MAG: hypothetical protein IJ949_02490, partial [Oscillospiraceae bacterium]|nr:hypothetical protein [Oscillospiraceae bacterium]